MQKLEALNIGYSCYSIDFKIASKINLKLFTFYLVETLKNKIRSGSFHQFFLKQIYFKRRIL